MAINKRPYSPEGYSNVAVTSSPRSATAAARRTSENVVVAANAHHNNTARSMQCRRSLSYAHVHTSVSSTSSSESNLKQFIDDHSVDSEGSEHTRTSKYFTAPVPAYSNQQRYLHTYKKRPLPHRTSYVAMDCEMVGDITGQSHCARVVVVNWKGWCLIDQYCRPPVPVADYRTAISGITAADLESALDFDTVRQLVLNLIRDKIVVGHALQNDFQCLGIVHPSHMVRDTALYEPFLQRVETTVNGQPSTILLPRKLRDLVHEKVVGSESFQQDVHCPIEDAKAALHLYKQHRPRWEACMARDCREKYDVGFENQVCTQHTGDTRQNWSHYRQTELMPFADSLHHALPVSMFYKNILLDGRI